MVRDRDPLQKRWPASTAGEQTRTLMVEPDSAEPIWKTRESVSRICRRRLRSVGRWWRGGLSGLYDAVCR